MVKETNARCIRIEANQSNIAQAIDDLKAAHTSLVSTVSGINERLQSVEQQRACFEGFQGDVCRTRECVTTMQKELTTLRARLEDAEDRSRRDNLLFFGIADDPLENWERSSAKIIALASDSLQLQLSSDSIVRAHRLGRYKAGSNRPIIAKFAADKSKDLVFSKRSLLSGTELSIKQDYSLATRTARKKLSEFSKTLNITTKLTHNKLLAGGKCYIYDPGEDSVHERVREVPSDNMCKPTSTSRSCQNAPLSPRLTRSSRTQATKK